VLAEVYPLVSSRAVARPFTYEVPEAVGKGAVVSIRFGRAAARGVVVATGVVAPAGVKTAPIGDVLYALPPALVDLALWVADYYEAVVQASAADAKLCANWVSGDLLGALNKRGEDITASPVSAPMLAGLIVRIVDKTISGKLAKDVFEAMLAGEGTADDIIKAKGLVQITDEGPILQAIDEVMAKNPQQLADYRAGKDKLLGFFVGQVMKATQGKANPDLVNRLLKEKLAG